MSTSKKRLPECDSIRILLTILVVIGHAGYYSVVTKFGGLDILSMMKAENIQLTRFYGLSTVCVGIIYAFHMPAFMALSGYLMEYKFASKGIPKAVDFIKSKAKRLLVPLVVVWLVWNIPIKFLSGYYSNLENPVRSALMQIIFPESVYLWFLEALFFGGARLRG